MNSTRINIIDSIMGSGKTTYIINYINNHQDKRFLIVVPTINKTQEKDGFEKIGEVGRYLKNIHAQAYEPITAPTKSQGLKNLIKSGKNIVTTHALIQRIDMETMELIRNQNYILVIDETLDCVHEYNDHFKKSDLKLLLKAEYVHIQDDGFLKWNDEVQSYDGRYENFKNLCNLKSLMVLKKRNNQWSDSIVIWNMPINFFSLFNECFILTYLFEGSFQAAYFKLNNIRYNHQTILNGVVVPYNLNNELLQRREKFKLIRFCHIENNYYKNNQKGKPFTKNWYMKRKDINSQYHYELKELSNDVYNFYHHKIKCDSKDLLWTTFKDYKSTIKGKGFTKRFLACNSKGTNDYQNCKALAYLIDLHPQQDLVNFFKSFNVEINIDLYSLSEMLQWIWRSQIRNNLAIDVYIPSQRMRELIAKWGKGKI